MVLLAGLIGWFWSGFAVDGAAPEGMDRLVSGLWIALLAFVGLGVKFGYLSVPFLQNLCLCSGKNDTAQKQTETGPWRSTGCPIVST